MIIIVAIFIFLFSVYALSIDDFVFMRRSVSLITLFDIAILSGLVGLFLSRLAYASLHPSYAYFNPLVFFVVPYFPGLSFPGFLIGAAVAAYMLGVKGKLPIGRIFDVFSLSLFPSTAAYFIWMLVESIIKKSIYGDIVYAILIILVGAYFFFFKRFLAKSSWKDGSLSLLSLAVLSLLFLFLQLFLDRFKSLPLELSLFAFFLCALFVSFLVRQFKRAGEK